MRAVRSRLDRDGGIVGRAQKWQKQAIEWDWDPMAIAGRLHRAGQRFGLKRSTCHAVEIHRGSGVRRIGQERRQHLHRFVSSKLRAVGTSNRSRLLPAKQVCRAELPEKGRPCRRYREAPVNRSKISRGESVLSWHLANLFWLCGTAISIRCRAL
jgi:hypothetical protein